MSAYGANVPNATAVAASSPTEPSASAAASRSARRYARIIPATNSTNPHVTPMSATLNTGKSMNTGSMKSTT